MAELVPLQITEGGNVIAMQIENEYGSYGNDKDYLEALKECMRGNGIDVPFFTSDGTCQDMLSGGTLPDVYTTLNFGSGAAGAFGCLSDRQPDMPKTCMEFWCGWFDHWGERHHTRNAASVAAEIEKMVQNDVNMNVYTFHGGTNFGFTAGANCFAKYLPTVTSYDDAALLNEYGDYTPAYHRVRKILLAAQGKDDAAPLPPRPVLRSIGEVRLTQSADLWKNLYVLGEKHRSATPESMEYFGQNAGYILYTTTVKGKYGPHYLRIEGAHDIVYVRINGKFVKKYDRTRGGIHCALRKRYNDGFQVPVPAFDGEMKIENGNFAGNYALGTQTSAAFGGAVYNNKNLTIVNSVFDGNYIDSEGFGYGGAIYNNSGANLTLENSILENNSLSSSLIDGDGGAVYNSGVLNLNNTSFQNNHGKNAENNDIFNALTGIVNFLGGGTNNINSGIKGTGTINKNDGGELNLGGNNAEFSGNFNFSQGTLNLLAQSSYFSASNTSLGNGVNFNMVNSEINNINFGALDATGTANIFADMDFNTNTMDRINANSFSGGGNLLVSGLNFIGAPSAPEISIPFADDVLKNHVSYNGSVLGTPIYDYSVSYDASDGNFELSRLGFNSAILSSEVAAQLAGYLTQIDTYRNIFENLDMVMLTPPENRAGFGNLNKIAASNGNFTFSPFAMPEQNNGIWFKPYSTFESVGLKNGPRVSNVSYGSLVGAESGLKRLKRGWYGLYGVYAAYNGSHQAFQGNSIYNNGGLGGVYGAFYRGNFFTVWTANAGASSSEANTGFGRDNFAMFNTGIAQMSGYNWQTLKRKLIIQPRIIASYSFINTFSYTTASNVNINTRPLNALQIEPGIKLIGNFKDFFQPYLAVSVVWNIIDSAKFKANDVYLPDLSVKPFVQYGAGVQKRWNDRFTCFFETMLRNGGRNGVALLLGMRITI